jgi:AcrR family transcriptional regulator
MLAITSHGDTASGTLRIRRASPARQRILDAARLLLRDGCYLGFSMDRLARACGLSRQTVYNQFADREDLYRASRSQLLDGFVHALPRRISRRAEPAAAMESFTDAAFAALASAEHVELSRSAEIDAGACPWIAETYARRVEHPLADAVQDYLGSLPRSGLDAAARAAELVTMLRAAVRAPGAPPLFTAAELATLFVQRALAPASGPQPLQQIGTAR